MSMMLLSCRMYLFRLLSTLCQQTSLNNLRTELYYFGSLLKIPGVFVVVASQSSSLRNILNSFFPHQPGSLHKLCKAFLSVSSNIHFEQKVAPNANLSSGIQFLLLL